MHKRNYKLVTITMPPEEHEDALGKLPHGEARSFSALVRLALKKIPRKKK